MVTSHRSFFKDFENGLVSLIQILIQFEKENALLAPSSAAEPENMLDLAAVGKTATE